MKAEKKKRLTNWKYVIPKAYSSPIPISEAKKKDLLNLCTKGIIPQELHSWYETLPTSKDIIDRLCESDVAEEGENDLDFWTFNLI